MAKNGNFDAGKDANFVVLELGATALQQLRVHNSKTLAEKLFVLMIRNVFSTVVNSEPV